METHAIGRFIRVAPRKLQVLVKGVKTMTPEKAIVVLSHLNKSGSQPLKKVIESALANAKQQGKLANSMTIKHIEIGSGASMKRFRAVSRGMAHTYKKRMSHIKVILTEAPVKTETKTQPKEEKKKE